MTIFRSSRLLLFFVLIAVTVGCNSSDGSGASDDNDNGNPPPLGQPSNLTPLDRLAPISVTWDAGDNAESHNLYAATEYGFTLENYAAFDGGTLYTQATAPMTLDALPPARIWHFAVTAVASDGTESGEAARVSVVANYSDSGDDGGIIVDELTGLEWQRCSVGQAWNPETKHCDGEAAQFDQPGAEAYDSPDADGWRSPSVDELMALVFCPENMDLYRLAGEPAAKCTGDARTQYPAIYRAAFPDTAIRGYYTRSRGYAGGSEYTKAVNFASGSWGGVGGPDYALNLRLVRDPE